MVLNLKPATALVALLTADALQLTSAERSRREQLLGGASASASAANQQNKQQNKQEPMANLVVDAEFHRAMLADAASSAEEGGRPQRQLAAAQPNGGDGGGGSTARERFAEQPRIQRMLANIRRKRALTGTVTRGVNKAAEGAAAKEEEEEVTASDDLDLVECVLDIGADVGLLGDQCDAGYACVPSDASALGGLCAPAAPVVATHRTLQDYCPAGCPAKVCECYEAYDLESPACLDALVESCRDGSYVTSCGPSDKLEQAYSQAYCDAYVCLADSGLTDSIAGDSVCDVGDDRCAGCYCTLYGSLCNIFRPLCEQGSDAYVCYDIDYVCDISACCAELGPADCIEGAVSLMPTFDPAGAPGGGGGGDVNVGVPPTEVTPTTTSGAASDLLAASGGGRYALLGASAVAAGLAQTLF
eukprot:CAMPEP_0181060894 /NCGR_PEP_ID=MMETSP1070-20121207/22223_1 /TAXON_ID=265543 /ORGANISM="Minutocellus polymorphus, Strain NH13" /LENGTH=415 /DNA_ID=CAMNT_0023140797 /DNA_START=291 /DNA_END=1538 /DNA_ORIENTATION=-